MSKYDHLKFDKKSVTFYYLKDEFDKIPKSELIQFSDPLCPCGPIEGPILETWKKYFESVKAPYALMRCMIKQTEHLTIWKRRMVKNSHQNEYYRARRERLKGEARL